MGTITLETERLVLRKLSKKDAKQMFANWASDPKTTKYLTWPPYTSVEKVERFLTEKESTYDETGIYDWGIVLKGKEELIGTISVINSYPEIKALEMGYVIGRDYWKQGYMTEALKRVIDYLFTQTDTQRIEATHDSENKGSGYVMRKCGMQFEGELRQKSKNNRGIVDQSMYSILRRDWENKRQMQM